MAAFESWLRKVFGRTGETAAVPASSHPLAQPRGRQVSTGNNGAFAVALYRRLRSRPGNVLFSPFSVRTILGMTHAGARGTTAAEMREALFFPPAEDAPHDDFAEIIRRLDAGGSGEYEFAAANGLWGQEGQVVEAAFLESIARRHGGTMNLADFRHDAESARERINLWVEGRTNQRVRDLVPEAGVTPATRLVLVNAVYFKGRWELRFSATATSDETFYLGNGDTVLAPLMRQRNVIPYVRTDGYQAVELNYRGDELSMFVLLPDRKDGLRDLEEALSVRMLDDCWSRMASQQVEIFLPRFRISWGTVDLRSELASLGLRLVFDRQADLSGINGRRPPHEEALFVSAVFHKAFLEVNEEGTEAAAASAVATVPTAMRRPGPSPTPIFRADHPFLFAVRERDRGTILFLGRIADPTRGR